MIHDDGPIYLDRNENNYGPAPACFEVLRNADYSKLSFYTKAHTRGVKSELSERLAKDFHIPEEQVLLGYGAEDLLKQVIQCYLGKNEKLMIPSFSWWYYREIANEVNGCNVEYPLVRGTDSFSYDVDGMLALCRRENPKVVFISSPNNPTGNTISSEELDTILHSLRETMVVLDEAYWYSGENENATRLVAQYPNILIVRTFSKYYALAGVRIGYALRGKNLTRLAKLSHRYLGYNRLSEEVALAALDSADYYREIARKMREDKERYYSELGKLSGFTVFRSNANFILVEIAEDMMKPLKNFLVSRGLVLKFMDEPVLHSHIRITLGTQDQNLKVIAAIKEFCRA